MARVDPFDRPDVVAVAFGDEEAVYRHRARRLGLSYTPHVALGPNAYSDLSSIDRGTFAMAGGRDAVAYLAPTDEMLPAVAHWLARNPTARRRLVVATPSAIRMALQRAGEERYADVALNRLERIDPVFSARRTITLPQAITAAAATVAVLGAIVASPATTLFFINLVAAVFFLGVSMLRFAAAGRVPLRPEPAVTTDETVVLPVYTILVPLLHEAHIVGQLVAALDGIDWPRDRLDVKLIVEEDDTATRHAAMHATRGSSYEVVVVPDGAGPRTKPMALQYALTFARGSLITIYDAEDRPHPGQLKEAFETFRRADEGLACLQAPIVIDNARQNLITRLFAIEYSTVFDGILPALAQLRLPLPLGGTSNHFRGIR